MALDGEADPTDIIRQRYVFTSPAWDKALGMDTSVRNGGSPSGGAGPG
jgi:hypothetical protein